MDQEPILSEATEAEATKSIGWVWRAVIALVALIVVGFLAYPFIQEQPRNSDQSNAEGASEAQASIAAPEATARANPDSAEAQFELGNAYVQTRQWEQAAAAYQRAIELDPNYQAAYANLGVVYYQQERLDLAASQYKKALELNPDDGEVAYNLGALYLQQALLSGGQPDPELLDQAIAQLQQAQELAPDLAEPNFSLGVAYAALNQRDKAIEAFETFLKLDTGQDPRASQEAESHLQTLRGE